MAKRGPKPKGQAFIKWSPEFAYAIGLFTADGCVLSDGRHIDFTSKDYEQVARFVECLRLTAPITTKRAGRPDSKLYYRVQFSDVIFRSFLIGIGITPAKSKTITSVQVPEQYFRDFLRGYFDGDGSSSSYDDSLFPNSYRFYVSFMSASPTFVHWLQKKIQRTLSIKGHISRYSDADYLQLKYAKTESLVLVEYMYDGKRSLYLKRKYLKIQRTLSIIQQRRGGEIGNHAAFRSQ